VKGQPRNDAPKIHDVAQIAPVAPAIEAGPSSVMRPASVNSFSNSSDAWETFAERSAPK